MQTTETKRTESLKPFGELLAKMPVHRAKGGPEIFYTNEEPVQVFSENAGLGKNYAGFRITFRIKDGEKRFTKFTTLEKGEIFPKREDPSTAEISRFREDINREAGENPYIMAVIKSHPELQL